MARAKPEFSRREREVIDIVYALGHATAQEIRRAMRSAPTDAAVRTTLRILVDKGHLRIEQEACGCSGRTARAACWSSWACWSSASRRASGRGMQSPEQARRTAESLHPASP